MKNKKILILPICIISGILVAYGAYISTEREYKKESSNSAVGQNKSVEIYNPVITDAPEASEAPEYTQPIYYIVQSNGKLLILYEVDGDTKKEINSFDVNSEMFPPEDRELLKKGIKANTMEEGIEIIENFIS